ncbi:succinylglutamate desuccinylase/aspartoacylase family protein [Caedibacter taeniospiralis]|jgi:predicted deacylase|uniref:succinylglutamate desuccinylase/aspartoacylase domain-containing protein n=1 Tax=Caedibacter taeniospiralis TaxID=28907 RepID=UPI0037BFBA95
MMIQIREIPFRTTISGLTHSLSVIEYRHPKAKANIYMQAALHAAESNGIALIYLLRQYLKTHDFPYNVTLVPFANPFAMDIKIGEYTYGRFDAKTGENWNRGFKNLLMPYGELPAIDLDAFVKAHQKQGFVVLCEQFLALLRERLNACFQHDNAPYEKLANILHHLALNADFSFDLHCDSISVPYIYAPNYLQDERLRHFNSNAFILTPNEPSGCFNQAIFYPWWQLTECWNNLTGEHKVPPKHAFTYEMGNKESFDLKNAETLLKGIIAYIKNTDIAKPHMPQYACLERDFFRIRAPMGGMVAYADHLLGGLQKPNTPLATMYDKSSILALAEPQVLTLAQEALLLTRTSSATVHEGDEVLKVMTQCFEI